MPKRVWSSGSESPSPGPGRPTKATKATQKRPRVLSRNGKDFETRIKEKTTIVISSDDEAPDGTLPETPIISDSETDGSSLRGEWPLHGKSVAERFAKVYDQGKPDFDESDIEVEPEVYDQGKPDFDEPDIEVERDKTPESSPESGKSNHRSYPIRYLTARKDELQDELGKTKQVVEQGKTRELELLRQLTEISRSIEVLSNQAAIPSEI